MCVFLISPNLVTDEEQSLRTLMTESSEVICSPTELSKLANKITRNFTKMDGYRNLYRLAVKKNSALCSSKSAFPQEIKQQSHQRVWPELFAFTQRDRLYL